MKAHAMKRSAPAPAVPADAPRAGFRTQPNELDLRRIERLLEKRIRYRYVSPRVEACDDGYRVVSPCCSRNVDTAGGDIEIARLVWDGAGGSWRLYSRDHARGEWMFYDSGRQIDAVLMALLADPFRVFWP